MNAPIASANVRLMPVNTINDDATSAGPAVALTAMTDAAEDAVEPADAETLSDYGSEFSPEEESILDGLLHAAPQVDNPNQDPNLQVKETEHDEGSHTIKLPRWMLDAVTDANQRLVSPSLQDKDRLSTVATDSGVPKTIETRESRNEREASAAIDEPVDAPKIEHDFRSPLERFRTKPRKSLSVTDLISPSWCELQYWYTLTKHGRKRRTPAMKQGSAVHKVLEEQVHTTVPVKITKKEDSWGLRIWNVIQGLRTLRETGITRELEIWGTVDGLVVNGIIDELSYDCPDRELERSAEEASTANLPPEGQATITDFLSPSGTLEGNGAAILGDFRSNTQKAERKVYITDVKTRGIKALPQRSTFRPTLLQLMVYHRLLSKLAAGQVGAESIFERFDLDLDTSFTDEFIAQIGSLNERLDSASQLSAEEASSMPSTQDSLTVLLQHNSLRSLWALMSKEFAETFPRGARSLGKVLKTEYRDPVHGEIMGVKTSLYDDRTVTGYLADEMRWWRGERAPQGVCIEEAFKCGSCEFFDECSWRKNKIEDAVLKTRERKRSSV